MNPGMYPSSYAFADTYEQRFVQAHSIQDADELICLEVYHYFVYHLRYCTMTLTVVHLDPCFSLQWTSTVVTFTH